MKQSLLSLGTLLLTSILAATLAAGDAWAGSHQIDPVRDTCTQLNCGSVAILGTYSRNDIDTSSTNNFRADPFVTQLYGDTGECLRLDTISQTADMEIVLVSPDGTIWRNNDRSNSTLPLVVANTTTKGWYTLQVHHYTGGDTGDDNFVVNYGRYNTGNSGNCSSTTSPNSASLQETELESQRLVPKQ
ncbi:MAG: hypothetical protein H7Y22_05665 [Gemmatimonadaceae bacterium]|nr:hypothetical protein [Gloeobacterales cyanobacterium ES-bin-141]